MSTVVVLMLLVLLAVAVVIGAAVIAAYTGLLRDRAPELNDRLASLARLLDADAGETAARRS